MKHPRAQHPDQPLCEACGYPIEGLPTTGVCPECGRPIAASLPGRRLGSPWQRGPGIRGWLAGAAAIARQPAASWEDVRIEERRTTSLLITNLAIAALAATGSLIPGPISRAGPGHALAFFSIAFILMLALTSIEFNGLRFFGRRHGFRITRAVAHTACAHASFAWTISGVGVGAVGQVVQRIPALWNASLGLPGGFNRGVITAGGAMLAAFLLGMVIFSLMCGVGYRALRFANQTL